MNRCFGDLAVVILDHRLDGTPPTLAPIAQGNAGNTDKHTLKDEFRFRVAPRSQTKVVTEHLLPSDRPNRGAGETPMAAGYVVFRQRTTFLSPGPSETRHTRARCAAIAHALSGGDSR
jgi:hypothetical protein